MQIEPEDFEDSIAFETNKPDLEQEQIQSDMDDLDFQDESHYGQV